MYSAHDNASVLYNTKLHVHTQTHMRLYTHTHTRKTKPLQAQQKLVHLVVLIYIRLFGV